MSAFSFSFGGPGMPSYAVNPTVGPKVVSPQVREESGGFWSNLLGAASNITANILQYKAYNEQLKYGAQVGPIPGVSYTQERGLEISPNAGTFNMGLMFLVLLVVGAFVVVMALKK